jgi:hypothetical protein
MVYLCEKCPAKRVKTGVCSFTDLRCDADYSRAPIPYSLYLSSTPPAGRSPWTLLPDFDTMLHKDCVQHILYNGGIASDVSCAALKRLLFDGAFGRGTMEERVVQMHRYFQSGRSWSSDSHECKIFTLRRMNMHKPGAFPTWGLTYKHGHIKDFVHFSASVAGMFYMTGNRMQRLIVVCLTSLSGFIRHLEKAPAMLSERERLRAVDLGQSFLDSMSLLIRSDQIASHQPLYESLWRARPKMHNFWHTVQHLRHSSINVLVQWSCWQEEDFMGKIARIYRKVHAKVGAQRTLQRYLIYLHIVLKSGVTSGVI